jgi:hypothetical protein
MSDPKKLAENYARRDSPHKEASAVVEQDAFLAGFTAALSCPEVLALKDLAQRMLYIGSLDAHDCEMLQRDAEHWLAAFNKLAKEE